MSNVAGVPIILVVEDEAVLRMVAVDLVEENGFDAIAAADADAAIRTLESRSDIRILFTDIDMPAGSMNGLKLAAAVHGRWPKIRIIVASGHYNAMQSEMPAGALFFAKPYEHNALIEAIKTLAA